MNKFGLKLIIAIIIFIPSYSFGYYYNYSDPNPTWNTCYRWSACDGTSTCCYDSSGIKLGCNLCSTTGTGGTASPVSQCNDGIDNDGNGYADYPNDPGCFSSTTDNNECCYVPPSTIYPGTIYVSPNIPTQWNIYYASTGELVFSDTGSGAAYSSRMSPLPLREGDYSISWGNVSGYTTPASQSLYLVNNGSIIFYGDYTIAPLYVDIGLRFFDGSQTIKIAVEPTGTLTSPLRIAKNGIVYGIVLVDITDPSASKMRVRTSGGIKAVRRL